MRLPGLGWELAVSGLVFWAAFFWSIRCILLDPFSTTASESFLPAVSAELRTTFLAIFVAPFFNVFPIAMRVSRTSPEPLRL